MNKLGNSKKLSESEVKDYLKEYSRIISELGSEDNRVLRTGNNPIGDYGEWLVAKKLNLELYPSSEKSFDAYSGKLKYQIKSRQRRILPDKKGNRNLSRQLGVIRNLSFYTRFSYFFSDLCLFPYLILKWYIVSV